RPATSIWSARCPDPDAFPRLRTFLTSYFRLLTFGVSDADLPTGRSDYALSAGTVPVYAPAPQTDTRTLPRSLRRAHMHRFGLVFVIVVTLSGALAAQVPTGTITG